MGSLEHLQKQLMNKYYSISTTKESDKSSDLINKKSLLNYDENIILFDKILSDSYYHNDCWQYYMRRDIQEIGFTGLFLGSYYSANKSNKNCLIKNKITSIICIRNEYEAMWIKPQHNEFNYLTLSIDDTLTQNIIPFFELTNQFILETLKNGGRVLVHSNTGISRATTIVAAFIMFYYRCSSNHALKIVQTFRLCSFPNENFRAQLAEYTPILNAKFMSHERSHNLNKKRSLSNDELEFDE